jgi:autotransporter-associated beta strand protein
MFSNSFCFPRMFPLWSAKYVARAVFLASLLLLSLQVSQAGSATWRATPQSSSWNDLSNWMPRTIPNGSGDVATFQPSSVTSISLAASITLDSAVFPDGLEAFTFNLSPGLAMNFDGAGVVNNTSNQTSHGFFLTGDSVGGPSNISFGGNAMAGNFTFYHLEYSQLSFSGNASGDGATIDVEDLGEVAFGDDATAGQSYLNIFPQSLAGVSAGVAVFTGNSNAGTAIVSALGANAAGFAAATVIFQDNASAATGSFYAGGGLGKNRAGGQIIFQDNASAAQSVLLANAGGNGGHAGNIYFNGNSSGGTAFLFLLGNSALDISGHNSPGMSLGALEGDGRIYIGANNLTVGETLFSRTFTGSIRDGGAAGGTGGSLTKVGTGQLTLSGASSYRGGTIIASGLLTVNNTEGSATGSGPVQVQPSSVLNGSGVMSGAVTVSGTAHRLGILEPGGTETVGQLTTGNRLAFRGGAYNCTLDRDTVTSDTVSARGVKIRNGTLALTAVGSLQLPLGAVFTVLNNMSATPIAGTFTSLPEGSVIQLSNPPNNLLVSYLGGDGNDMTLTVVP